MRFLIICLRYVTWQRGFFKFFKKEKSTDSKRKNKAAVLKNEVTACGKTTKEIADEIIKVCKENNIRIYAPGKNIMRRRQLSDMAPSRLN